MLKPLPRAEITIVLYQQINPEYSVYGPFEENKAN